LLQRRPDGGGPFEAPGALYSGLPARTRGGRDGPNDDRKCPLRRDVVGYSRQRWAHDPPVSEDHIRQLGTG